MQVRGEGAAREIKAKGSQGRMASETRKGKMSEPREIGVGQVESSRWAEMSRRSLQGVRVS